MIKKFIDRLLGKSPAAPARRASPFGKREDVPVSVHGIDPNRMLARGMGSKKPPPRKLGESPRAYQYRLSRVEFTAVEANPL